jgi:predicted phosphodiesterase
MRILLLSDIHGNYPALRAISEYFKDPFDLILNGGDTTVYAPFPNQTINWLRTHEVPSILGNTDRHVITLLNGSTFKKPGKPEKRIMYGITAAYLTPANRQWLTGLPQSRTISLSPADKTGKTRTLGMFHGSPDDPDEFLFSDTPLERFRELAVRTNHTIITVGHSHTPFHKLVNGVHFINPGSVGRMFDGDFRASCAVVELKNNDILVSHYRISYPVEEVTAELKSLRLPAIYREMYRKGRKLN